MNQHSTQPESLLHEANRLADIVGAAAVCGTEKQPVLLFRRNLKTFEYDTVTEKASGGIEIQNEAIEKAVKDEVPVVWPGSADNDNYDYKIVDELEDLQQSYGGNITKAVAAGGCVLDGCTVEGQIGKISMSLKDGPFFRSETGDVRYVSKLRPPVRATSFELVDPSTIPEREFLFDQHYIRKYMTVTLGAGGGGKSAHSITEALAMATGRPLLDPDGPLAEPLRVWLINCEDPQEEIQRRIAGACIHYNITAEQLSDNLFVDSGRDQEFVIFKQVGRDFKTCEPLIDDMLREIERNEIDVIIVDPFVSTHHAPENDNSAMQRVAAAWVEVADRGYCSVELIHHISKGMGPVTADSGRGAGAVKDKARSVRVINPMSGDEAVKSGVEDRTAYFTIGKDKSNMAPKANSQRWRKFVSVNLNNGNGIIKTGDSVGVVEAWRWPADGHATDDVSAEQLAEIKRKLLVSDSRESSQSTEWAGRTVASVLELDVSTPADRARIKQMLVQWIGNNELKIEEKQGVDYKMRKHIQPVWDA